MRTRGGRGVLDADISGEVGDGCDREEGRRKGKEGINAAEGDMGMMAARLSTIQKT